MDNAPGESLLTTRASRRPLVGLWLLCFAVAAVLYLATCQCGVQWQDGGLFQWRVLHCDWTGKLGLALAHVLYITAAQVVKLVPVGDFCTRLTMFNSLGMAVAVANLACLGAMLTGRRWIGLVNAGMFAVAHVVWWMASTAKPFGWVAAGLTLEMILLVRLCRDVRPRNLLLLALVSGMDWSLHNFALLPLPVYVVLAVVWIVRRRLPAWVLPAAAGLWLVGGGLLVALIAQTATRVGIVDAIHSALVGNYARQTLSSDVPAKFIVNGPLMALSLCSLLLPLAIVGWLNFRRRLGSPLAWSLAAITLIHFVFAVRYNVPDQFIFFLPTVVMIAIASAVGLGVLADKSPRWRTAAAAAVAACIVLQPVVFATAPAVVRRIPSLAQFASRERSLPFRDEIRWWLTPWKCNEHSAEQFAQTALRQAAPDGVILCDSTGSYSLRLTLDSKESRFPGVTILTDWTFSNAGDRAALVAALAAGRVYVVSPKQSMPQALQGCRFEPTPGGCLYVVRCPTTAPTSQERPVP